MLTRTLFVSLLLCLFSAVAFGQSAAVDKEEFVLLVILIVQILLLTIPVLVLTTKHQLRTIPI